ncbi:hypothetical protein NE865_02552 [Phthorimaea operculella]|nr:hypothetical protein NE865_02552 [Phthorimaea operculella]
MSYILLIEVESPTSKSCKITGLPAEHWSTLQKALKDINVTWSRPEVEDGVFEADTYKIETHGVQLLNMLNSYDYNSYKVISQSMAIEKSYIGGRNIQKQKIAWTLKN